MKKLTFTGTFKYITDMIDPTKITNFNRSEPELQEFLLFCIIVAGKNSQVQSKKLAGFLAAKDSVADKNGMTPFEQIQFMCEGGKKYMIDRLKYVKMGQYKRIGHAFQAVSELTNLTTITVAELETIKGIGSKTARFFVMHSRPNQRIATLDTHILRWLRSQGHNVPKSTPPKKQYLKIEQIFLNICDSMGKTPAELDLEIWKQGAVKS